MVRFQHLLFLLRLYLDAYTWICLVPMVCPSVNVGICSLQLQGFHPEAPKLSYMKPCSWRGTALPFPRKGMLCYCLYVWMWIIILSLLYILSFCLAGKLVCTPICQCVTVVFITRVFLWKTIMVHWHEMKQIQQWKRTSILFLNENWLIPGRKGFTLLEKTRLHFQSLPCKSVHENLTSRRYICTSRLPIANTQLRVH